MHGATTACLQKVLHLQQIVAELELKALNRSAPDLEERVACVGRSPNNSGSSERIFGPTAPETINLPSLSAKLEAF